MLIPNLKSVCLTTLVLSYENNVLDRLLSTVWAYSAKDFFIPYFTAYQIH